jgi:hypothetical protein
MSLQPFGKQTTNKNFIGFGLTLYKLTGLLTKQQKVLRTNNKPHQITNCGRGRRAERIATRRRALLHLFHAPLDGLLETVESSKIRTIARACAHYTKASYWFGGRKFAITGTRRQRTMALGSFWWPRLWSRRAARFQILLLTLNSVITAWRVKPFARCRR